MTKEPAQFKLSRVQLVNWGTFDGYYDIPVGEQGFLITGASGSGKSTLIDAFSTILVPYARVRYNAAAQQEIGRDKGRNRVSYIRGAWRRSEDSATGDIKNSYLRDGATASIIALSYRRGEETVTLIAIFRLNAGQYSNDQIRSLYGVMPMPVDADEFLPLLTNSLDKRKIEQRYKTKGSSVTFTDQYSVFANRFRAKLGIGSEEAQMLLHRTQSAKSLSSMDELFREYMLEEPSTFNIAEEAVATYGDLQQAYERLEDANRQIEVLSPLPTLHAAAQKAAKDQAEAESFLEALPAVQRTIESTELRRNLEDHEAELEALSVIANNLRRQKETQHDAEVRAAQQRNQFSSGGIQIVEDRIAIQNDILESRRREAEKFTEAMNLDALDIEVFSQVKAQAKNQLEHYSQEQEALKTNWSDAQTAAHKCAEQERPLQEELASLSKRSSNIDKAYVDLRATLCAELGLSPAELPYVGELIDVLPQHKEWEPVIQRLLRGFAITLLVPDSHQHAVSEWVNGRHLGRRLDYRTVPADVQLTRRPSDPASMFNKITVVDHPMRPWLELMLTTRFDYLLVRTVSELHQCSRRAATIDGLERNPSDNTGSTRYVKNDGRRLGLTSDYRLGSSNHAKLEALRAELDRAKKATRAARHVASEFDRQLNALQADAQKAEYAASKEWAELDVESAETELSQLRDELELLTSSPEAQQLENAYIQAREARSTTEEELTQVQNRLAVIKDKVEDASLKIAAAEEWLKAEKPDLDDEVLSELESRLRSHTRRLTAANLNIIIDDTRNELSAQQKQAAGDLHSAESQMTRLLSTYISSWTAESAELQADAAFAQDGIERLKTLRADRLPEFRGRFLDLLNGQSVMHLSQITTQLNRARSDIETGLEPINASLRRSPYTIAEDGPRYLQIEVRDNRGKDVIKFQQDLREATSGSLSTADEKTAIERYHRLAEIMNRLSSTERSDERWRRLVLDTRRHVKFVGNEVGENGEVFNTHVDSAALSGGQAQKLVFFCLAAALRYRLAGVDADVPEYATIVLDEAFDRADPIFTRTVMDVFTSFGFHMVLATPMKLIKTLSPYVNKTIVVNYSEVPKPRSTFEFIDLAGADSSWRNNNAPA